MLRIRLLGKYTFVEHVSQIKKAFSVRTPFFILNLDIRLTEFLFLVIFTVSALVFKL